MCIVNTNHINMNMYDVYVYNTGHHAIYIYTKYEPCLPHHHFRNYHHLMRTAGNTTFRPAPRLDQDTRGGTILLGSHRCRRQPSCPRQPVGRCSIEPPTSIIHIYYNISSSSSSSSSLSSFSYI